MKSAEISFGGNDLQERVTTWYQSVYGNRMKSSFQARGFAIDLRGTLWRIRCPYIFGTVAFVTDRNLAARYGGGSCNVLQLIDDFTPAYAARLNSDELDNLLSSFELAFVAVEYLNELRGHHYFDQARLDYEQSVEALMTDFAWSKARWDIAQCAEKVMKGLLALAGDPYPAGRNGHHIPNIGKKAAGVLGLSLDPAELVAIDCHPDVRYGEVPVSRDEACAAHQALLSLLNSLGRTGAEAKPAKPGT